MIARFIQVTAFIGLLSPFGAIAEQHPIPELPEKIIDIREVIADANSDAGCDRVKELYSDGMARLLLEVAFADLLLAGRCLEQDVDAAKALLEEAIEDRLSHGNALARLGWLHEAGIGVQADSEKATTLYRRAVGEMLPWHEHIKSVAASSMHPSTFDSFGLFYNEGASYAVSIGPPDQHAQRWNLTRPEAVFNFVDSATGPWELPRALMEERSQLVHLMESSENGFLMVAKLFRLGSDGYPADHQIAFSWIQRAAMEAKRVDAMRTFLNWFHDPSFCPSSSSGCMRDNFLPNRVLANLAATGDAQALIALRQCVEKTDLSFDKISKDRYELVARLHPEAMQDHDALEEARQDLLKKLGGFEPTDKHEASANKDVQHNLGQAAFGEGLAVFILLRNTPCPYLGS